MKDFANREIREGLVFSLREHGEDHVSPNFKVKEFRCRDGSDLIVIHPQLPLLLEAMRTLLQGRPIIVNSGFRTPSYNRRVGGAVRSMHLYGMAADIYSNHFSPEKMNEVAEALGAGASALYSGFLHVDVGLERDWGE